MPRPSGLGRGLDSLIPGASDFARANPNEDPRVQPSPRATALPPGLDTRLVGQAGQMEVAVGDIQPNPKQPRSEKGMTQSPLDELAASIREHGIIQPLVVKRSEGAGAPYTLIAGERRWRAAQLAGLKRVPVVVKDIAPGQMLEVALIENIQRHDLNALEEAQAYQQLMHELALTHEQVAGRVGKSRSTISNTMRLLELPDRGQQALMEGAISEGHARAILGLKAAEEQLTALDAVVADGLSVRQTEELIRRLNEQKNAPPPKPAEKPEKSKDTKSFEAKLRGALGTKVSLNRGKKGGKIVIEFYSDEEFEALYGQLVGSSRD